MSRFNQLENIAGAEPLASLYQDMIDHGFGDEIPIGWLTSQSTCPDILAGTWTFSKGMLLQGELPMMVKQMVAATIAARNNCNYCQDLHGDTLSMLGVSQDVIKSCVTDPELAGVQQPHKAILEFAVKVAKSPAQIAAEDVAELLQRGVTREEVLEIIALSAYCNFINTWADISRIRPESESARNAG